MGCHCENDIGFTHSSKNVKLQSLKSAQFISKKAIKVSVSYQKITYINFYTIDCVNLTITVKPLVQSYKVLTIIAMSKR